MKKIVLLAAGLCLSASFALAVSGCASQPTLTPPQIAQLACPAITTAVSQLTALSDALPEAAVAEKSNDILTDLQKPLVAACASAGTITASSIQGLAQQVLPAIGAVLITIPLPPTTQAEIQGGLVAAETLVGAAGVIEEQIAADKAAKAAAAASAASAVPAVPPASGTVVAAS